MAHQQPDRYLITARGVEGALRQTRVMAASAMVLARSWREAGHVDIRVTAPSGRPLTLEGYKASVLGRRNALA